MIPSVKRMEKHVDDFARHYIIAALWSTTDNARPDGGDPLEDNYGIDDLHPDALAKIEADCARFRREHADLVNEAIVRYRPRDGYSGAALAGHDFWLTRNGHGVGFWDRDELDEGGLGKRLTDACKAFGEVWIYVGDDGKLYV